jgi:putative ABC transport system permease protein
MSALRRALLRLYNVVRPGRAERQLTREIEAHLALLEEDFRRKGRSPADARAAARRAFGGVEQAKELYRDARSFMTLDDLRRDIGYAARTLRRTPGFTAVAIVTLTLGIGSVAVIYSVIHNVLLEPFPYPHSRRMVDVVVRDASNNILRGALPVPEFLDYQEQATAFEDVIGTNVEPMHFVTDAGAERLNVAWMTPNGFAFLGVRPLLGRVFGPADAAPGAPLVAVMKHRTWMTLFGADPAIVGQSITLNGEPRTIIGVMPPRFEWHVADLWIPGSLNRTDSAADQTFRWFQARLKPGGTLKEAQAQLDVIAVRRAGERPRDYPQGSFVQVITVIDWVVGRFRGVLYTLFAAVGLLLLIACCNVMNMLLARATAREREIAVRAALGASRGRIVRQLVVESALLAIGGGIGGCLLAYGGINALARLMPRQGVPWETELRLDQPVLLFALATAAAATLVFGLFPALQSARRELVAGTNAGGRSGTAHRQQRRMRSSLVVAEVALSIVLLLGAGLLMRSVLKLATVDLGIDPGSLVTAGVWFPPGHLESDAERQRFAHAVRDRLAGIPGVESAAVSTGAAAFGGMRTAVRVPGVPLEEQPSGIVQFCSEGFFSTIGLRIIAGRLISSTDIDASRKVVVVNETFVRRYFGDQYPIGRTVGLLRLATLPVPVTDPTLEIIGVVQDVANQDIREPAAPQAYVPLSLRGPSSLVFTMRTTSDPQRVVNMVRQEIRAIDRLVAVVGPLGILEDLLQQRFYAQPRFTLIVLLMFAGTGLALVALGVYGVMAYTVSQQTREIAIRMAVGGEPRHVRRMVLRTGMHLLGAGIGVGLAASAATNRLLVSQLWNISPYDPVTLIGAVAIIVVIGAVACSVPARRAMRVEPIVALRHE